ncbi:hypothetical protein EE612_040411 [Oryza sativa]|nr:hypothetical protein EE612_040411 [Oryza sativa]
MGRSAPPSAPAAAAAPARGGRKRKRHLVTTSPAAQVGGWASLPTDLTRLVAGRVLAGDVVDYIAFRAVCSGWRACAPSPRDPTLRKHLLRPRAWVALCDGDAARPDDACETPSSTPARPGASVSASRSSVATGSWASPTASSSSSTSAPPPSACSTPSPASPSTSRPSPPCSTRWSRTATPCSTCCTSATSPMTPIAVIVWFPYTAGVLGCEAGHPSWEVIHKDMELLNTLPFQGRLYGFRRLTRQIVQVYLPNPLGPVVAHVPAKFGDPDIQSPAPTT